jgi:hypothetical protein
MHCRAESSLSVHFPNSRASNRSLKLRIFPVSPRLPEVAQAPGRCIYPRLVHRRRQMGREVAGPRRREQRRNEPAVAGRPGNSGPGFARR